MYRIACLTLLTLSTSGCGWGYAKKMERETPAQGQPPTALEQAAAQQRARVQAKAVNVGLTVVPGARDLVTLDHNHTASQGAHNPQQMSQHAFKARLVDGMNNATQLIHCTSGKVIRFDKRQPSADQVEKAKAKGIPTGVWFIEIDPDGTQPDLPNTPWYRHINKHHILEYVGRNAIEGTVIYKYIGPRPTEG